MSGAFRAPSQPGLACSPQTADLTGDESRTDGNIACDCKTSHKLLPRPLMQSAGRAYSACVMHAPEVQAHAQYQFPAAASEMKLCNQMNYESENMMAMMPINKHNACNGILESALRHADYRRTIRSSLNCPTRQIECKNIKPMFVPEKQWPPLPFIIRPQAENTVNCQWPACPPLHCLRPITTCHAKHHVL